LAPRSGIPFDDPPDDWEEEDYYTRLYSGRPRPPSFRDLHPNFESGAVHPELIYPIEHGPDCEGHRRAEWYCEDYLWSYEKVPKINFLGSSNVVPVREEYL
jgi:hypothetical protein